MTWRLLTMLVAVALTGCGSNPEAAAPGAGGSRLAISGELPSRAQPGESRSATAEKATLTMTKAVDRQGLDDVWNYVLSLDSGASEQGTLEFDRRGAPILSRPRAALKGTTSSGSDLADFSQVTSTSVSSVGQYPSDLYYTKTNLWVRLMDSNTAIRIGATDYLQNAWGDVYTVDLPPTGSTYQPTQPMGQLEAVMGNCEFDAPVAVQVIDVNVGLNDEPELVNIDCYGRGWLVDLRLQIPFAPADFLTAEEYANYVASGAGGGGPFDDQVLRGAMPTVREDYVGNLDQEAGSGQIFDLTRRWLDRDLQPHAVTTRFQRVGPERWRVQLSSPPQGLWTAGLQAEGEVLFRADGSFESATLASVSVAGQVVQLHYGLRAKRLKPLLMRRVGL